MTGDRRLDRCDHMFRFAAFADDDVRRLAAHRARHEILETLYVSRDLALRDAARRTFHSV
jgi:hypothetical protein